jgi:hypothetical protein
MLLTILSGLFGGLLRLAPELLKFFDSKNDRQHELAMQDKALEFQKLAGTQKISEIGMQGNIDLARADLDSQTAQFAAYQAAFAEQAAAATAGGKLISAISALVRPAVTGTVFAMWCAFKLASLYVAITGGSGSAIQGIIATWTQDDAAMLMMIVSFWFVGRSIEKRSS